MHDTLTQTFTRPCPGRCGGDMTIVLDGDRAYATTDTYGETPFTSQGTDRIVYRTRTGIVEVVCAAADTRTDETCDGVVVLEADEVRGPRETRSPLARYATPMEIDR